MRDWCVEASIIRFQRIGTRSLLVSRSMPKYDELKTQRGEKLEKLKYLKHHAGLV